MRNCGFQRYICLQLELLLLSVTFRAELKSYQGLGDSAEDVLKADPDCSALHNLLSLGKKLRDLIRAAADAMEQADSTDLGKVALRADGSKVVDGLLTDACLTECAGLQGQHLLTEITSITTDLQDLTKGMETPEASWKKDFGDETPMQEIFQCAEKTLDTLPGTQVEAKTLALKEAREMSASCVV